MLASRLLVSAILSTAVSLTAFASDSPTPRDPAMDDRSGPERTFDSRERLERVVLLQDRREIAELRDALESARSDLQRAIDAGAEQAVIDRLQAQVDRRQASLDAGRDALASETRRVRDQIANLSDEQVFAFNRSLQNAISSGIVGDLDSDVLKRALGADLDCHQINALTQALEQEARFLRKADRMRARADATGNDRFFDKADRFAAKAASEKQKFLDRVRRTPRDEIRRVATADARAEARKTARSASQEARRDEVRDKQAEAARREAARLARKSVADDARERGRGFGKVKKKLD